MNRDGEILELVSDNRVQADVDAVHGVEAYAPIVGRGGPGMGR